MAKESNAWVRQSSLDGSGYREVETARLNAEYGYGLTLYGWDGDTLAWESGTGEHGGSGRTTHYVYEPESFVPMAQAVHTGWISLHEQPEYDEHYDIDRDPLWSRTNQPTAFARIGYYQCDQIGTPQEVTDEAGEVAWSARYKAWGEAKEVISEAARKAGIRNPIRFQGQYFDHETGLHYNRYRYYDPNSGRFISKDPIGLVGGLNGYQYAPNPIQWIDPIGLARKCSSCHGKNDRQCDEVHDDYNQAMNSALDFAKITAKRSVPNPAKFGSQQFNGRRTPGEYRGFRVEHDERHGAHINVFNGKGNEKTICFNAAVKTVVKIVGRFNR